MTAPGLSRINPSPLPFVLMLAALLVVAPVGATAKVTSWIGGGGSDNWSDASNWDNGVPVDGDDVMFTPVAGASIMDIFALDLTSLDMTGFLGTLYVDQPLSVFTDVMVEGNMVVSMSLAVGGTVTIPPIGSITLMSNLDIAGDLWVDGTLMGHGFPVTTLQSFVVLSSGYVDITYSPLNVGQDLVINGGTFVADFANITTEGRIDGGYGSFSAVNAYVAARGRVNFQLFASVDMSAGYLLLDLYADQLTVGAGHTLGDVQVMSAEPAVYMITNGAWNGIGGNLTVSQGTLDLRDADLIVVGSTTVEPGATILVPSATSGHTHEFWNGLAINNGTFLASSPGTTIKFGDGSEVDVIGTGSFWVNGGGGGVTLTTVLTATQWALNYAPTTNTYIRNTNIEWGDANPPLAVHSCVDLGNNIDFIFIEPDIDVVPAELAFGVVGVGTTEYDSVMVHNIGTDSLYVSSITNSLPEFVPSPITPFVLLPGDSQAVSVSFQPLAVTTYLDSLVITSDDPDEGVVKVPLSGQGAMPDLVAVSLSAPSELTVGGESFFVSWGIQNQGGIAAPPFYHSLRISADAVLDTTDVLLAQLRPSSDVEPGFVAGGAGTVTLPKTAPRGAVYLGVIADDLDEVMESNENNNTYSVPFSYQVPLINSVIDVPFDQGGSVFLSWYASPRDPLGDITEYTLWRTIDVPPAAAEGATVIEGAAAWRPDLEGRVIRMEKSPAGPIFWEHIATHGAFRRDAYGMALPSLFDSTGAGFAQQYFQVIAHTAFPDTFYLSAVDSGYSVDNLAPAAPQNLAGEQTEPEGMQLTWDANGEADLAHYAVYRGTDADFVPGPGNRIGEPPDPGLFDDGWRWDGGFYYKVAAVDVHGNESPVAVLAPDLIVGVGATGTPRVNALLQNRPNPFSAKTTITFDLAEEADVSIRIYDVQGRLVRTLLEGRRGADRYTVDWEGLDDRGHSVAGGVYFYRIEAGPFVRVRKLIVIR